MKNGKFQITIKLLLWDRNFFLYLRDRITNQGDLPGGRIQQDEIYRLEEALIREIREELGEIQYEIQPKPVFVFPHFISKDNEDALLVLYSGNYWGGKIQLSNEHTEYLWIHKNDRLEKYFSDTFLKGLREYFLEL